MHSFTGDRLFPISNCEECFCIHVCMYKPLHLYYMLDGERERKDKIKLNAATMISTAKKYCVHWTENIYVHRLNRRSMFSRLFRISLTFFILVDSLLISTSPSYFFGCLSWHNLSYFSFFFSSLNSNDKTFYGSIHCIGSRLINAVVFPTNIRIFDMRMKNRFMHLVSIPLSSL